MMPLDNLSRILAGLELLGATGEAKATVAMAMVNASAMAASRK